MNPSEKLTNLLIQEMKKKESQNPSIRFFLAISGGSSPLNLFKLWSGKYLKKINWNLLDLFWVDERCVSPDHPESNYGTAKKFLIDNVPLLPDHIHRIHGENDPQKEAILYEKQIRNYIGNGSGFDMVILGIGEDGHTSSIFPGQIHLLNSEKFYGVSVNPYTGQNRIALTSRGILSATYVCFYITGPQKAVILEQIADRYGQEEFPAGYLMNKALIPLIFWDNSQTSPDIISKIIDNMPNMQIISS